MTGTDVARLREVAEKASPRGSSYEAWIDPPTVLALLDALADREARLAAVEALADAWDNPRWRGHDTAAPFARAIRRRLGPSAAALHPDPSEGTPAHSSRLPASDTGESHDGESVPNRAQPSQPFLCPTRWRSTAQVGSRESVPTEQCEPLAAQRALALTYHERAVRAEDALALVEALADGWDLDQNPHAAWLPIDFAGAVRRALHPDPSEAGVPCPKHRARGVNPGCGDCDHPAQGGDER